MTPKQRIAAIEARLDPFVQSTAQVPNVEVRWLLARLKRAEELLWIVRNQERLSDEADAMLDVFLDVPEDESNG
jgi:hypothetical protein